MPAVGICRTGEAGVVEVPLPMLTPAVTKEQVLQALEDVKDPELRRSVVELNMVREVKIEGPVVFVEIALTVKGCPLKGTIEEDVRNRLLQLPGVEKAIVKLGVMTDEERRAMSEKLHGKRESKSGLTSPESRIQVLAIASGKGGVGKSTVTVNVAAALTAEGYEVGILDADIYGFSVPLLLGLSGQRPQVVNKALVPLMAYGMQVMSMGFFVDEHTPLIWRGPMLGGAVDQFLNDVLWADLDYLLIDLPPGTGDVPLSLIQRLPRSKMVLVTTPQPASYHVAARAAYMARMTKTELLGIVENMAYFKCPGCDGEYRIFGYGGAERLAGELHVPILGRIPLVPEVREGGDEGRPAVIARPDSPVAAAFREVAQALVSATRAAARA